MAKSALIKSSLAKKYWMAFTGLFLCLFLVGHLLGNLQLFEEDPTKFNQYAKFMTTNPVVKLLSYLVYISLIFHAIDGIILTVQNRAARPVKYAKNTPGANSSFASRNMAVLGTIILVFLVTHMTNFWAKMHFSQMPIQITSITDVYGNEKEAYLTDEGEILVDQVAPSYEEGKKQFSRVVQYYKDGTGIYLTRKKGKLIATGLKDLHKITIDLFKSKKQMMGLPEGLIFTLFYVISMVVLAFHLWHGFQSAFQSMGINNSKWNNKIKLSGKLFSIVVPLLFAVIPIYIHLFK